MRPALYVLLVVAAAILSGCRTAEIKNQYEGGFSDGTPTGTIQSDYGQGHGDAVGGGGAAPAIDASKLSPKEIGTEPEAKR